MTWDQILELLLGLVVVAVIVVEIINWLAIRQTNKLSLQKLRGSYEARQQIAEAKYSENSLFISYKNFAVTLTESINRNKLIVVEVGMPTPLINWVKVERRI